MPTRAVISFREAEDPIREPVTKFGGQPAWIEGPTWPLSRATGRPMRFLGQVALDPTIFADAPARAAYLFLTDEEECVDGTYEPEGGENAVVLQPGRFPGPSAALVEGPTLYRMVEEPGASGLVPEPCEFAVTLAVGEDGDPRAAEGGEERDGFENKVGGVPDFLQGEEYPEGGPWRLLLQLDSASVPFYVNFGDAGVGYAFLSEDGSAAKFLWQCC